LTKKGRLNDDIFNDFKRCEGAGENLSRLWDRFLKLPVEDEAVVFDADKPDHLQIHLQL